MTKTTKFTPGHWTWAPDSWNGGYLWLDDERDEVVLVPWWRNEVGDGAAWFDPEDYGDSRSEKIAANLLAMAGGDNS